MFKWSGHSIVAPQSSQERTDGKLSCLYSVWKTTWYLESSKVITKKCARFICAWTETSFITFRYPSSLGTKRNEDLLPEVPTTQLTVIRTEGSGEELWGWRLVKSWHSFHSHIIFIFSDKEPGTGGLEKGQLNNNNGNKNVKIKKRLSKQNNNSARASHFLVHFFAVTARLRNETSYCHSDDHLQIFLSLYKLDRAVTIKLQNR